MSTTLAPVIEELHRAHGILQAQLHTKLSQTHKAQPPMPIISIERRGRKHTDFWFEAESWKQDTTNTVNFFAGGKVLACDDSITVAAEILGSGDDHILAALLMGMVLHSGFHNDRLPHLFNKGYHHQAFANEMEALGVLLDRDSSGGFRIIKKFEPSFKRLVKKVALDPAVFDLFRKEDPNREFKGSGLKKFRCSCTNLRASVYFEAQCLACGDQFIYVDKDASDPDRRNWIKKWQNTFSVARKQAGKPFFRSP